MLYRLRQFMQGRYGFDRLGRMLAILSALLMLLTNIITSWILTVIAYAIFGFCIFRILSKNVVLRLRENRIYMEFLNGIKAFFKRDRKYYRYMRCPKCRKVLKVPKHKGKISITCPHCRYDFIKKT